VVDRTGLILDIFALHAQSKEASLQVELALSIYLKPRLAGLGKTLNQQGGGIGTRGPGETKLETDNRLIDNRINKLKREIKKVSKQREVQSSFRKKNNTPLVSIVGYTNAGKSTMLEKITSSKTYVANELFATVDSLQRELKIDGINEHIILSDTVGFIQNLPTTLIESFKSTLTVVKEANLLIHVVDAASAIPEMHINTVHEILNQIEADVPEILVFNKIDRIDKASLNYLTEKYPDAIFVSSTKGTNIENLISEITTNVFGNLNEVSLIISPKDLDQLHKYSSILSVENIEEGLEVTVEIRNYYLENLLQKDVVKLLS
jgi:GTP-binding protein HflX